VVKEFAYSILVVLLRAYQRDEIEKMGRWAIEFAQFSLQAFNDIVLGNKTYLDLILGDIYTHQTYYIGMVDENNKVNFYDGKVSVVAPDGVRLGKYAANEYTDWIAEHVEPWTYLKFPYLKKVGWKGFVDGKDSGVYMAPLSRLNAADGMATPLAQAGTKNSAALWAKPVHQRLAILERSRGALCRRDGWSLSRSQSPATTAHRPHREPAEVWASSTPRHTDHHYQPTNVASPPRLSLVVVPPAIRSHQMSTKKPLKPVRAGMSQRLAEYGRDGVPGI
jgi:F420-non-reducing hydrogenase large subunit